MNGSGDEPLILSLKSNGRLSASGFTGRETFIKTATVIATVYVGEDSVSKLSQPYAILINIFQLTQKHRVKMTKILIAPQTAATMMKSQLIYWRIKATGL